MRAHLVRHAAWPSFKKKSCGHCESVRQGLPATIEYGRYARRPPADRLNVVSALSLELDSWFEDVPVQLKVMPQTLRASGDTIVMNIYYHFISILLHRNIDPSRCRSAA